MKKQSKYNGLMRLKDGTTRLVPVNPSIDKYGDPYLPTLVTLGGKFFKLSSKQKEQNVFEYDEIPRENAIPFRSDLH